MTTIGRDDSLQMIDTFYDWLEILDKSSGHIADFEEDAETWMGMRGQVADFMTLFDPQDVGQVVRDRDMWPTDKIVSVEARCMRCGETFNPNDPADFVHFQRNDGNECGGFGLPIGDYGVLGGA